MRSLFLLGLIFILSSSLNAGGTIEPMVSGHIDTAVSQDMDGVEEPFGDGFDEEFENEDISSAFDPLSGYNRLMTGFNDVFYSNLLMPVAKGYKAVMPQPIRVGVKNVFTNVLFPIRFVNNVLQLKFVNAKDEVLRFGINSTVGIAGLMDPALDTFGIKAHDEDFRQTLGHYGVGSGFPVVLPFFGPSNLRAIVGNVADGFVNPVYNVDRIYYNDQLSSTESLALRGYETVNRASFHVGEYAEIKKDAVDLYPLLQNIYEQHEAKLIKE